MMKVFLFFLIAYSTVYSQYLEDAIRLSDTRNPVTTREAALGTSYYGILNDGTAISYNPAGIALIKQNELSFGLNVNASKSNDINYLNIANNSSDSKSSISNFSLVLPYAQNWSLGLAYFREASFSDYLSFDVFNTTNSAIQNEAEYGFNDPNANFAVVNELSLGRNTPIRGNVQQRLRLRERGSIHNLSFAMGYNWLNKIAFGASVSGKFGSYIMDQVFEEEDINKVYRTFVDDYSDLDFWILGMNETIDQQVTGVKAELGIIGNLNDKGRISFGITLPQVLEVDQIFSSLDTAYYDNGDALDFRRDGRINYSIILPVQFNFGASYNFDPLTLTAGIKYTDLSATEFQSTASELNSLNFEAIDQLTYQLEYGFGAEFVMPGLPMALTGSYSAISSPYQIRRRNLLSPNSLDTVTDTRIIGFGLSYFLGKSWRFDLSGNYQMFERDRTIVLNGTDYNGMIIDSKILNIMMGMSFRF